MNDRGISVGATQFDNAGSFDRLELPKIRRTVKQRQQAAKALCDLGHAVDSSVLTATDNPA